MHFNHIDALEKHQKNMIARNPIFKLIVFVPFLICHFNSFCQSTVKKSEKKQDELIGQLILKKNYDSVLTNEILLLQDLVEKSLEIRSGMIKITAKIKSEKDGPISSENINYIRSNTQNCIQLRNDLLTLTYKYRFILKQPEKKRNFKTADFLKTKAFLLSLSAALTLYDNYILGTVLMEEDKRLRKFLNESDQGFGITKNQLLEISLSANSIENQKTIKKGILYYEEKSNIFKDTVDSDFQFLSAIINSSPSYNYLKNIDLAEMSKKKFKMLGQISTDIIKKTQEEGSNSVSMFFGNSIGLIETRKGKLYNQEEVLTNLKNQLQPLDIILEKTPFRLTDKLIPGHFGHVAIWVGTKEELIQKGLWDHEIIKPYQSLINSKDNQNNSKDGKQIVEALRSGVQLSSLEDFMNVDDVVILRPIFIKDNPEVEKEALLLTFRQLGKEYDFNFDVNTTEKIVCSELAYICFPTIDWETKKMAGRYTISPDNVARLCINGSLFELITFYHDGKECSNEEKLELLKKLTEIK